MTSTWIRCLMRTWIVLLLLVFNTSAAQTSCAKPQDFVRCTENVAVGTKLLKIPINPNENWSIFESSPAGYYRTSKGATSLYIEAAHVLDSDVLKEKTDHMYVKLICKVGNNQPPKYEIMIILTKANEFTPEFNQNFYNRTIPENARINDIVFQPSAFASDKDFRDDITFGVHSGKSPLDGIASKKFRMSNNNIVVNDILDYENQNEYTIEVTAKDSGGKESSTTLAIYISDVDDLGPTFLPRPCTTKNPQCMIPVRYNAHIKAADKGKITISPNAVKAVDNEANHYGVVYSFTDEGNPTNIMKYFQIDPTTAEITKKDEELPKNVTSSVTLFIKAEEVSPLKHSSVAILIIDILDRNSTIIISTKSSDSISVGAIFTLLGVLLSAILVFSAFGLAFWIRQKKNTHQPLPGSTHYFNQSNLSTKVFPIRDQRASECYMGGNTIRTTILRGNSDETTTSDHSNNNQSQPRNLSAKDPVKCSHKEAEDVLKTRQRPTPISLRSLALPIRSERSIRRGHSEKELMGRNGKSEEIFLERRSPSGSNFGTFRSSNSSAPRGMRKVTNGTLETYVSEYPTLGCESSGHSMSRNSSKRRDTEKSDMIGAGDGPSSTGSPGPVRVDRHTRGREKVDSELSYSAHIHNKCKNEDPCMPTEIAPPIPCSTNKNKLPTPIKPPRKFSNKEPKDFTKSYDQQTRTNTIQRHSAESSERRVESSNLSQGRHAETPNKLGHVIDLSQRVRRSPMNSTAHSGRSGASLSRSSSKITRLTEAQITELTCRRLRKKLHSLERSRISNARRSQTLEQLQKKSERVRQQTSSTTPRQKDSSTMDASSFAKTKTKTHHVRSGATEQRKWRGPPPLPARKYNTAPNTNTRSNMGIPSSEEDDPKYVNVKYLSLIGDSATDLSNRLAEFSSSSSLSQNHSQGDDEDVYLEPGSIQPCLEADLNIRAKLELILASALQKKNETHRKKTETDLKDEKQKKEETPRNNSLILPVAKCRNPNSSSSSFSSSYSEIDDVSSTSCVKSRSLENIFLGSADVVWPDPETTIAALRQHHLAMEDYTAICLARQKLEQASPCNSITSNSSNTSRCHFGYVNSHGQFIVDIPCAESNTRVAKSATPMAIPFRDVETTMEVGMNSPTDPGAQIETSIPKKCDDETQENSFPQKISFDGLDQYEMVHRHMVSQPSSQIQTSQEITLPKSEEEEKSTNKNQIISTSDLEREEASKMIIDSLVSMLKMKSYAKANDRVSNKSADKSTCSSRRRSIYSDRTFDSLSQDEISIRSDCATVMSSELYEPSDSDRETVRSLKLFDSIFDNEDSVIFSSAESDSQSVFRACHPPPISPVSPDGQSTVYDQKTPVIPVQESHVSHPISSEPLSQQYSVCYPTGTGQVEKEMRHENGEVGDEVEDETDDTKTLSGNGRTGSYSVSVGLPSGVDAVYKEPILNAYKTVNEDGSARNETTSQYSKQLPRTFVKIKKSKRIGRKNRNRLKFSTVY